MKNKIHTFLLGDREISYSLTREKRKRFRIVIAPDLAVSVFVPLLAQDKHVVELLYKKRRWITRTLERIDKFHPLPAPKEYISGETILYRGRQYRLKVEQGEPVPAKMKGRFLQICVADRSDIAKVKQRVEEWYRQRGNEFFHKVLKKSLEITARHGIPTATLTLRKMRTRWGSCSGNGSITINTSLIQAPSHCVEYVIMHELCHLKHHNHSKAFYKLLTQCMPDWQKRKAALQHILIPESGGS